MTYQRLFKRAVLNQGTNVDDSGPDPGSKVSTKESILELERSQTGSCMVGKYRICDPALLERNPLVWIPRDENGASEEVKHSFLRSVSGNLLSVSDEGAHLQRSGHTVCDVQQFPEENGIGPSSAQA